jgi:hypothetical protein
LPVISKLLSLFGAKESHAPSVRVPPTLSGAPTLDNAGLPQATPIEEVMLAKTPHRGPVYQMPVAACPRYPNAVPAATPEQLMKSQRRLINDIQQASDLPWKDFDEYIMPVIREYAAYVHMLPASLNHHHAEHGGLFRHGLEVAYYAAIKCEGEVFAQSLSPRFKKEMEPRWRTCAILTGLLHDLGKAYADVGAKDESGTLEWKPDACSLYDWLVHNKLPYYYIYWRPGTRGKRHEASTTQEYKEKIPRKTIAWLIEYDDQALASMKAAIAGDKNPSNQIAKVLERADQASVIESIKTQVNRDAGIGEGWKHGIGRRAHQAMHDLIESGEWKLNEPGHPIWVTTEGVFVKSPEFATKLAEHLRTKEDFGIAPPNGDEIIRYMDDAQIFAAFMEPGGKDYIDWIVKIHPYINGKYVHEMPRGKFARIRRVQELIPYRLVDRVQPAYAEVYDANDQVVMAMPQPWATDDKVVPIQGRKIETPTRNTAAPAKDTPASASETQDAPASDLSDEALPSLPPSPLRDRHSQVTPRMEKLTEAHTTMTAKWPPLTAQDMVTWLRTQGGEGQLLIAIAERVQSGELNVGRDLIVHGGYIHIRFPDGLDSLGQPPRDVLDQLEHKGWIIRDPTTMARATVSIPSPKGKSITAVRLNENISIAYALLIKGPPAGPTTKKSNVPPGLGPYIDRDAAQRLHDVAQYNAADTSIVRAAFHAYLDELRLKQELSEDATNNDLQQKLKTFTKQHKGLSNQCVFGHVTARPNEVITSTTTNWPEHWDKVEGMRINNTYDVELDHEAQERDQ